MEIEPLQLILDASSYVCLIVDLQMSKRQPL